MPQVGTTIISLDSARISSSIRVVKYEWTSSGSGDVTIDFDSEGWPNSHGDGQLLCVVYVSGTPAPTSGYNVLIEDVRGLDVLKGSGSSISSPGTVIKTYRFVPTGGIDPGYLNDYLPVSGSLILKITGAGNSTRGFVYLFIR